MHRKGILLAGGSGSRLYPASYHISKHLLPVYDKPMVYYPLCTLMLAGVREIQLISTPHDLPLYQRLLGDGRRWGITIEYAPQPEPGGLAQALLIASDFLCGEPCIMILGDNIFHGDGLATMLLRASARKDGATVFAYRVNEPGRYGVVEFSDSGRVKSIEEKPSRPKSCYALTGLYLYDGDACALARQLSPSARGELEITDLNRLYLNQNKLTVECMRRGYAWLDTGTHASLLDASNFIETIENRQGIKLACPEELAWRKGWISDDELLALGRMIPNTEYGAYLINLLQEEVVV